MMAIHILFSMSKDVGHLWLAYKRILQKARALNLFSAEHVNTYKMVKATPGEGGPVG